MHWFESIIYFSAATIVSFMVPLWWFRLLSLALILFPLEGHSGYGGPLSYNHYIHHAKFNWNFGSSPMWDYLMSTTFEVRKDDR